MIRLIARLKPRRRQLLACRLDPLAYSKSPHTKRSFFLAAMRAAEQIGTMATNLCKAGASDESDKDDDDSRRLCVLSRCSLRKESRSSEELDVCDGGGNHEPGRGISWPAWFSRYNLYSCSSGVRGSPYQLKNEDEENAWPSSDCKHDFPIQARRVVQRTPPAQISSEYPEYTVIDARLKIFKLTLPRHYWSLLEFIKQGCIDHAKESSCGWM